MLDDTLTTVDGVAAPTDARAQMVKLGHGAQGDFKSVSADDPLPVDLASDGRRAAVTVTRPANVTAYTAGDVVGGVITFPAIGPAAGHVLITSADVRYDVTAIPPGLTTSRLHLYSVTPPSALADNAAWDLPAGDRAAYIGYVDFTVFTDLGSTLFTQVDGLNKQVMLAAASSSLFGYLQTIGGFAPANNSEVLQLTLCTVGV